MEQDVKKKKRKRKKLTKTQEDKRRILLKRFLNKWFYFKMYYGGEEHYIFVYHRLIDPKSITKIEQIILSHDQLYDGVYQITSYDLDTMFVSQTGQDIFILKLNRCEQKIGFDAEDEAVSDFDELKEKLIGTYLTEEEFMIYCQNEVIPPGVEEIILDFDSQEMEGDE
jgi:hypothetical protein